MKLENHACVMQGEVNLLYTVIAMDYVLMLSFQYYMKLFDDLYVCMVPLFLIALFFSSFMHKGHPRVMA